MNEINEIAFKAGQMDAKEGIRPSKSKRLAKIPEGQARLDYYSGLRSITDPGYEHIKPQIPVSARRRLA